MRKKYNVFVWYPDNSSSVYESATDLTMAQGTIRFLHDGVWRVVSTNWEYTEQAGYGR
jgi:hypothetical protein